MAHHGAAALSGAQPTVGLPLERDLVGAAVALDGSTVLGAERLGHGRPDLVVVAAGEQPALALENRSVNSAGSASSTVGASATAVAPPSVGALRQANIIRLGNNV